jgi:hypothetical protein
MQSKKRGPAATVCPATVNPAVRHPARRVLDLGGAWSLRIDPHSQGARQGWADGRDTFEYSAAVPGSVNALEALGREYPSHTMPNAYEGGCWYQRRFKLPAGWSAPRAWLQFGGIMPAAHVWLNGRRLGYHAYSPVAVKFDATDALRPGAENVIVVELPWQDLGFRGGLIFGSGLWRTVELEGTAELRLEDLFIRPRLARRRADVAATLCNDGPRARQVTLRAVARPASGRGPGFEVRSRPLRVAAGRSTPVTLTLDMPGARAWTPDDPRLYVLTLEVHEGDTLADAVSERFGMRELTVGREALLLNGEPLIFRAVCDEFFGCPTLAPIVDPALIRRRLLALKALGFNAKRYHTHMPPREELDLCDELGILVHAEISVISNFSQTGPYPESRAVWKAGLRQVRNHASLVTYCMGNEGSQIMDGLYDRAREYYADAKALAPDTPVLAASGMQGEHPVPNDYETPHFWSRYFVWAYDGLTALPWRALDPLAAKGPLVVHEYGKYTVWPDPREDRYFRAARMPLKGNYGAMGRIALKEAGLESLLPRIVRHSRALAAVCNRLAIEEARRQPGVTGYHILSAFRLNCNRGMVDDLARHVDPEFQDYPAVNGPTALLIDRTYRGRTLTAGQDVALTVHLSHFGAAPVVRGRLRWRVENGAGAALAEGVLGGLEFPRGRNGPLAAMAFRAPDGTGRISLTAELAGGGKVLARNRWDFWHFAAPDGGCPEPVLCDAAAPGWDLDVMAAYPAVRRLDDFVSVWKGDRLCKASTGREGAEYLATHPVRALIADHWDDGFAAYARRGGSVLLLNTGHFPEDWYAPKLDRDRAYGAPHLTYDMYTHFAPFRTGWDHGNACTIFERHPALRGFPHEGWADLQCFAMIQGAKTLRTARLPGPAAPILRVIPMWKRSGPQSGPSPDLPDVPRPYETENRVYLAEVRIGRGRVLVSALRHFCDPAGRWLLDRLVGHAARQDQRTR